MFDTKLANSIQQDYRQAAETHRLIKATGSRKGTSVYTVILMGSLLATLFLFF